MARIGLKYFRYGILDEETETYDGALQLGKAVDCKVSLDLNSAELYADDVLVCDFNNHSTPNGRTYVGLGSTYTGGLGLVITACRIYEGVD